MFERHTYIESMLGHIFEEIIIDNDENSIKFLGTGDFLMMHMQDCCEDVYLNDVCGDIEDLKNSDIILAECIEESGGSEWGTSTWTFYKIGTNKGSVTLRFFGESNGYYSESISIIERTDIQPVNVSEWYLVDID